MIQSAINKQIGGDIKLLRKAQADEAVAAYQCIEDARAYHSSMGFVQWHPDYPTIHTIKEDIANGIGFVFAEGNVILGYCCMLIGDEPAYHVIDGFWKTDRPYAVVQRTVRKRIFIDQRFLRQKRYRIHPHRSPGRKQGHAAHSDPGRI